MRFLFVVFLIAIHWEAKALLCQNVFSEKNKNLVYASIDLKNSRHQIDRLTEALISTEPSLLGHQFVKTEPSIYENDPAQRYAKFYLKRKRPDGQEDFLGVLTNGKVMFWESTLSFDPISTTKKFKVPAINENGEILFLDMGQIILDSLPSQVQLSRSLSAKERENWLNDERQDLGKKIGMFKHKVHFAFNHYRYKEEPYHFNFSKADLQKLYDEGYLQLNTYGYGMPREALTDFGIPFELVVTGEKAMDEIRPIMKKGLQQGLLPFQVPR